MKLSRPVDGSIVNSAASVPTMLQTACGSSEEKKCQHRSHLRVQERDGQCSRRADRTMDYRRPDIEINGIFTCGRHRSAVGSITLDIITILKENRRPRNLKGEVRCLIKRERARICCKKARRLIGIRYQTDILQDPLAGNAPIDRPENICGCAVDVDNAQDQAPSLPWVPPKTPPGMK